MTITAETILSEVATITEARSIARDMKHTWDTLVAAYGEADDTARAFGDRYFDFVDAMADKFSSAA